MRFILSLFLLPAAMTSRAQGAPVADLQQRLDALERRLNAIEGSPAKTSPSAFNPAMGLALDMVYQHVQDDKADFLFRTAEVSIESSVDPFLKGWTILNGNKDGVDVEEAALQTTSLPCNLKITGGRLFASFGRLSHFHDHELPVIDRPRSIDTFIGAETQADGLEVSYLFPIPFYLNAVVGAYNKIGGDNDRAASGTPRPLDHFTYLGRLGTYADLGDDHSLELGIDSAWTPKRTVVEDVTATGSPDPAVVTRADTWRALSGADLTYRYHPAQGGLYRGAVWGTEVLMNDERRFGSNGLPTDRVRSFAGFSYAQIQLGRRWRPGVLADLSEDLDQARTLTRTFSAFLTYGVTEFQRLRLVCSRVADNIPDRGAENRIALQWTGVLGTHVHGYRDR